MYTVGASGTQSLISVYVILIHFFALSDGYLWLTAARAPWKADIAMQGQHRSHVTKIKSWFFHRKGMFRYPADSNNLLYLSCVTKKWFCTIK